MIWVERNQPQEISITESDGTDALTEADRIDLICASHSQLSDRFPAKARMAIKRVPIEIAQAAQRRHDLFQIVGLQTEEHVLKLGAVEIEADAVLSCGHVCAELSGREVSAGCRDPSRSVAFPPPRLVRARFGSDAVPAMSRVGFPGPSRLR